ncbi:MAG: serine/threonine protein kinase [Lentisphaeraceae bacterium]|nr:serine/threonine protein kinase [Lentisphaeraceae bacterium]
MNLSLDELLVTEDAWEQEALKEISGNQRYRNKELIASGGHKNVFRVFDIKMQRHVAFAEIKEDIPEEDYDDFINEACLTASLQHPNIVKVFDYGFSKNSLPYFTMELKTGKTLESIINERQISAVSLLEIFFKVCEAMQYSHSEGIIHLDLKPSNIQVGQFNEVEVCDWGLSREVGSLKTGENLKGTPGYMAPEQAMTGAVLDERTDVYSLGAILYTVLTGEASISGGAKTVVKATIRNSIVPPSRRCENIEIPGSLDAVVMKALSWSKVDRYQSVEAFKLDLADYLQGRSTVAEEADLLRELLLFLRRNLKVIAVTLILVIAFIFVRSEIYKSDLEASLAVESLHRAHSEFVELKKNEQALYEQKEQHFESYAHAVKLQHTISSKLVEQHLEVAKEHMIYPIYFSSPVVNLQKSLKTFQKYFYEKQDLHKVQDLIVLNLFLSQRFIELQNYSSQKYKVLFSLAKKYENKERSRFNVLFVKDFTLLLQDINALPDSEQKLKQEVIERAIAYSLNASGLEFTHESIVKELIRCWNPKWDEANFIYNKGEQAARAFGEHLHTLRARAPYSSHKSFLSTLKISRLDICGSEISSFNDLRGLSVKVLDIRSTKITNLHPHNVTKGIEKVYINTNQFDSMSKMKVPKSIRLVSKD